MVTPVDPNTENLAPGWEPVVYAKDQTDTYLPLPSLRNPTVKHCPVMSEWELDDGDIDLMKAMITSHKLGGPRPRIALTIWTFGDPLQPIQLEVGQNGGAYLAPVG